MSCCGDKVTHTFTNPIPNELDDKRYALAIELLYEALPPLLKAEGNVFDEIMSGKIDNIFAKIAPALAAINERIENFPEKAEATNAKCEETEDHHIMCVINKDAADVMPPDLVDAVMQLFLPNYSFIDMLGNALEKIAPISRQKHVKQEEQLLSIPELAVILKKKGVYLCKYCGMAFYSPQALGGHMKIHKGEKHGKEERTV